MPPILTPTPVGGGAGGVTEPEVEAIVDDAVAALVDSSPAALNTLNELAAALGDDANFATTVANSLASKAPLEQPIRFKQRTRSDSTDIATSSSSKTPIHATDLAYLTFDLAVGDVVRCELELVFITSGGNMAGFDFEVDRPTSANVYVRDSNAFGAGGGRGQSTGDLIPVNIVAYFVATEAGVHGFRPVMVVQSGGTLTIANSTTINDTPIIFTVMDLGPPS